MKKWLLRMLSAFLAFTLGLCATAVLKFRSGLVTDVQPAIDVATDHLQLPRPQITQDEPPVTEVMSPHPVTISPGEIKRLLEKDKLSPCAPGGYTGYLDFAPIWEKLSLTTSGKSSTFAEKCRPSAKVILQAIELDGEPGKETLLKLDFGMPESTLYLIFKRGGTEGYMDAAWYLLGYIDYEYGAPFIPPSHRVITAGTKSWLVVDRLTGHGSGFGSHADDWYEIGEKGVVPVLSYQSGLFVGIGDNPMVVRTTKVASVKYEDGIATVTLKSSTSYEGRIDDFDYFPVLTTERKATFIKGTGMREFIFDPLHSEMRAEELELSFGNDEYITNEEFLKYNYRELARLAVKGNSNQRLWLRRYLDTCNDVMEKESLRKILVESALSDKCPY